MSIRVAVLVDVENIASELAVTIMDKAVELGEPTIVQLFGDYSHNRHSEWLEIARRQHYQPVLQLNGGKSKNSTDIALTIHAMDILFGESVDAFLLVSNDRDFIPLASRLRAAGRVVHIVGNESIRSGAPARSASGVALREFSPIMETYRSLAKPGEPAVLLSKFAQALRSHAPETVPSGKQAVRKLVAKSGEFDEVGTGHALAIRPKQRLTD